MFINTIHGNSDLIVAAMAAISVFFSFVVVSWPYLVPDTLGTRMRELANEREAIRLRGRKKLQSSKQGALKPEPKKIFKAIFDRLKLAKELNDTKMVQTLRKAGYRGQAPIITFVAARVILPALLFTLAAFYVFIVLRLEYPFFVKLGILLALALLGFYLPAIYVKNRI